MSGVAQDLMSALSVIAPTYSTHDSSYVNSKTYSWSISTFPDTETFTLKVSPILAVAPETLNLTGPKTSSRAKQLTALAVIKHNAKTTIKHFLILFILILLYQSILNCGRNGAPTQPMKYTASFILILPSLLKSALNE